MAQPSNPSDESIAHADAAVGSSENKIAALVASLSESESAVAALELKMGDLREAVNKALVDLRDSQAKAEKARQDVTKAKESLGDTQKLLDEAQEKLDEVSRTAYKKGASAPGISGVAGNSTSENALARKTFLRTTSEKQKETIAELERLRTEKANEESALRKAAQDAEAQEQAALEAQQSAQKAIDDNSAALAQQNAQRDQLLAEQASAQQELDQARGNASSLRGQRDEYQQFQQAQQDKAAADAKVAEAEEAAAAASKAQEEAKKVAQQAQSAAAAEPQSTTQSNATVADERSAVTSVSQGEVQSTEAARQAEAQKQAEEAARAAEEAQAEAEKKAKDAEAAREAQAAALNAASSAAAALVAAAQPEHATTEDPYINVLTNVVSVLANTGSSEGEVAAAGTPVTMVTNPTGDGTGVGTHDSVTEQASQMVAGAPNSQMVETVIGRAMSQVGVPYAWGGGDANGPTRGIRDGGTGDANGDYNKVGFDCSGLVLYAFAGAGISLPHYTGYQYQRGTKVSHDQMQRGDLIFYGPGGGQHVAIYLGDGQMIEAPSSGQTVSVVPVRWSGLSEYAVRLL